MGEFLRFRRMVTPVLIQLLFWLGVVAALVGGVISILTDEVLIGVALLLLGPIAVRVYAELLIVLFRIHSALQRMATSLEQAPVGGPGGGPGGPVGGYAGPQGAPQPGPRPPGPGTPPPPGGYTPGG